MLPPDMQPWACRRSNSSFLREQAAAQNAFVSLSPLLISRCQLASESVRHVKQARLSVCRLLLSPLDVVSGQRFALKPGPQAVALRLCAVLILQVRASLCTTLLREASGFRGV